MLKCASSFENGSLTFTAAFFLVTDANADDAPCSKDAGVCICTGTCPSFTDDWDSSSTGSVCAARAGSGSIKIGGGQATVNGNSYDITSLPCCPGDDSAMGNVGNVYHLSLFASLTAGVMAVVL